ncbi:uncharacterized protein LOC132639469 [Lycium barbarum]|uniref:uncharacterized protein LOC132639469 n=1 Tax=Lycium barbarum TaxID=112863 RepID=UPI00293F31A7|nr:uncharacterized protein LOC132639469 [Lycium barbarum]
MPRKASASQKGKAVADEGTNRVPPVNVGQSESLSEAPSRTSQTPPAPEELRRATATAPLVSPPYASGQKMRDAIQLLTRAISTRVRDFINLEPPVFVGSNPDEYPQNFIDRMQRTLKVMHASDIESVELASYRLRDIAVQWYKTWELSRGANASPAVWQDFSEAFLRHYLPKETRRAQVDRFLALRQWNMSIQEYNLCFDSLARYAPTIVAERDDRMYRFVIGLGPHLINECMTASLQKGTDISRI